MISQLHGTLVEATMSSAIVDVSGVGFELGISGSTAATLPTPGGEVRLYTRMQVREDAMTLFGFASKDERTMFDRLVSVSGVGPRLALAVLSTYTEQAAEKLLKSSKYAQIDGVFCLDAFLLNQSAPAPEWDIESASARMISDDECELKVPVTRTDSTKSEVTLTAVKVDGSWRLNDIYEG